MQTTTETAQIQTLSNETAAKLGSLLLDKSFGDWFKFAFRSVEGRDFKVDKIHNRTFKLFDDIYAQSRLAKRVCLNQPPRSSKTSQIIYFFVYCSLKGQCNFIYTTFNMQLLKDAKDRIKKIVGSPFFSKCYGSMAFTEASTATNFVDDLFRTEYEKQGIEFSNTKIFLGQTIIYLTPLGTTTGLGAGVMGIDGYTGGIFLDDINKITDTLVNKTLNQRIKDYFSTNILTRLNNGQANILNVQQRISTSDLTSYLLEKYEFNQVSIPLLNADGSCNIASQYNQERIEELKRKTTTWMAQYQQEPVADIELSFAGQMFDYQELVEATKRGRHCEINPVRIMGVDPKREGDDNFAIVFREGKYAQVLYNDSRKVDLQPAVDIIIGFFNRYRPQYICIDSGKGEGIISTLRDLGYPAREIKFNASSHRSDAYNKRAAMYADILDWIHSGATLPDDMELIEDLCSQEYMPEANNLIRLVSKEICRQRIGRSPGLSDALALTFAIKKNIIKPQYADNMTNYVIQRNKHFSDGLKCRGRKL